MKKIKYELIQISESTSVSRIFKETIKETDVDFPWITGVMFHKYAGAGDTVRVGLETTSGGRVINPVPEALLNLDGVNRNFNDLFIPVNLPARGEAIKAILDANTVTTAFKGDFVLRLEKEPREVKSFQLYHKQLTVKAGAATWESSEIVVPSGYKQINGIWINTLTAQRVGIKKGGEYLLEPVPCKNLTAGIYCPYDARFFPVNQPAPKIVTIEIISLTTLGADITMDVVLLLQ
jgi:hypothetical protein